MWEVVNSMCSEVRELYFSRSFEKYKKEKSKD
jgi:hypothetical protein